VRKIVEAHGGRVWAESTFAKGFVLPRRSPAGKKKIATTAKQGSLWFGADPPA